MKIQELSLDSQWRRLLKKDFESEYIQKLNDFLNSELQKNKTIYPKPSLFFEALNQTPFEAVKVVIVGQDPYHGPNQAHGLCFSVNPEVRIPPSLKNIYKELESDLGVSSPETGDLRRWAKQGVLLLNSTLSVEQGKAGSHQKKGWEKLTDRILEELNQREQPLVFILWGSFAHKKGSFINESRHLVLKSVHPSPLSAHRGFFGTRPFSKANAFLRKHKQDPINWRL